MRYLWVLIPTILLTITCSRENTSPQVFCQNFVSARQCILRLERGDVPKGNWDEISENCVNQAARCDPDALTTVNDDYACRWEVCNAATDLKNFDTQINAQCHSITSNNNCLQAIESAEK